MSRIGCNLYARAVQPGEACPRLCTTGEALSRTSCDGGGFAWTSYDGAGLAPDILKWGGPVALDLLYCLPALLKLWCFVSLPACQTRPSCPLQTTIILAIALLFSALQAVPLGTRLSRRRSNPCRTTQESRTSRSWTPPDTVFTDIIRIELSFGCLP